MKFGRDSRDTHEPMQMRRHLHKYVSMTKRHLGRNRLKHRSD